MSDTYSTGLTDELDADEKALFEGGGEAPTEEKPVEAPPAEEKPAVEEPKAATGEEKPAGEDDDDGEDVVEMGEGVNKGRFIRHGAFHRQREIARAEKKAREAIEKERGELQQRIANEQIERARINERLAILMQATQPQQPEGQKQVPDPEVDPFAYMRYLESQISQLGQQTQHVDQRFQAQDEYGSAKTAFMQDAQRFASEKTDFMDAYSHLMQSRDRELALIGRSDPRERQKIIAQEEFDIVRESLRQGRSPAELFYALAADRGYRKSEPAPAAAPAPAPAPAAAPKSAVEQVKAISAAQASSKSLSSASGGGTSTVPTAESLASMSEAEFDALYSKMSRDQRREYFGG